MASDRFAKWSPRSRFLRFLIAGVANSVFGLAVYAGAIVAGSPDWVALLLGLAAGVVFNFLSLGGYAFRDLSLQRLPRFVCSYGVVYVVNLGLLELLRGFIPSAVLCQILLTPPMALLSYLLLSKFVFTAGKTA